MIITECVLHGFRGFAEPFTLHLKPGLNLVTGGNESGKSTLCEGILSAFFASPSTSAFLNWSSPEVCRLRLCFSTSQGRLRIGKDFVRRTASLSTWDPGKATFLSTTQDPSQVAGLLSNALGGVNEATYRGLYVLTLPPRYPIPLASEVTPSFHHSSVPTPPGSAPEKHKRRLQQLRGYLETYRKIRETELLLDSLRVQNDETRASLQALVSLDEERRNIREALERFGPLESLATASLLSQIAEYHKALASREEEAKHLEEKIEEERARLTLVPSTSIWRHRLFLMGAGVLLLSLVAGRLLPLFGAGSFIGLGCLVAALAQKFSWSQKRGKIGKRLQALEHQLSKGLDLRISRQFQSLLDLLPRTGCQAVLELATTLRQRDSLREKLATLDQKITELSAGTDLAALEEKQRMLEEAIQVAEGELGSLGYVPEPLDVQIEIEQLERRALSSEGPVLPSRERGSQALDTLLASLERLLGKLSDPQLSAIETQASRLIADITAGQYTRIRRTPDNSLCLARTGCQGERALGEVSDGTQDQAILAWRLALLTVIPQAPFVPLLLDDPFLRMDGQRRTRLLPFLQSLARRHQVILFSREAWIPPAAAHVVPLTHPKEPTASWPDA